MFVFHTTSPDLHRASPGVTADATLTRLNVARRSPPATGDRSASAAIYSVALAAMLLGGCATTPSQPTTAMTQAEDAIAQAQRAGADQLANQPIQEARARLASAKEAVAKHDNLRAAQLVDEAYADARLADLTAQSATATKQAAEVDKSIRTLETETTRVK